MHRALALRPFLHRYWFTFDLSELAPFYGIDIRRGCGVTAYDRADALHVMREVLFRERSMPPIREETVDVDVRTLKDKHGRRLATGNTIVRGVWYPWAYEL